MKIHKSITAWIHFSNISSFRCEDFGFPADSLTILAIFAVAYLAPPCSPLLRCCKITRFHSYSITQGTLYVQYEGAPPPTNAEVLAYPDASFFLMDWKRGTSTMALALHRSDTLKLLFLGITEDGGADIRFSDAHSLPRTASRSTDCPVMVQISDLYVT